MEFTPHRDVERVLGVIKSSMRQEGIPETPGNIVDAVIATFLDMKRRNSHSRVLELLQIVLIHKDHMDDNENTTRFIRSVLVDFRDEKIFSQGFRMIKHFIRNKRLCMSHFMILLEDCFGRKTLKTKSAGLIREYLGRGEFRERLVEYIRGLDGVEAVRHMNWFLGFVSGGLDVRQKLDEVTDRGVFVDVDSESTRKFYSECCDLMYNYTEMEMSKERPCEDSFDYIIGRLKILFGIPLPRGDRLLRTFSLVSEKSFGMFLREKRHMMKLDSEIKKEIRNELLESQLKNSQVYEFMKSIRHILIPEFMDVIRHMGEKYVSGEEKYYFALGTVVSIIGVEKFFEVVDMSVVDIKRWGLILRGSTNNDISFFVKLYRHLEESKCTDSIERTVLLNTLPAFCNYGSDHRGMIDVLLQIMKANISNPSVFCSICNGLDKLVSSHVKNLRNELILRNPIPVQMSQGILQAVDNSSIVLDILEASVRGGTRESDEILLRLIEMNDFGLSNDVFQFIVSHPSTGHLSIGGTVVSDLSDVLKIAKFFVTKAGRDFEMVSKLLELSVCEDYGIQKRAYQLLYYMKLYDKIELCICDSVFAEDRVERTKSPSQRWMVSLVYQIYSSGCRCFPERRREYLNRMLPVIILPMKTGNAKAKKRCSECIEELVSGFDEVEFEFYCRLMVAGMNSESATLRCGVLEAVVLLMEGHRDRLPPGFVVSIYESCVSTSRLGREPVSHVLKFLGTVMGTTPVNPSACLEILELYIGSFKDRYGKEIQYVINQLVGRDIEIPKRLKRFLKMKRTQRCPLSLQITKKNDVVITTEERREPKTAFVRHRRTLRPNKKHKK